MRQFVSRTQNSQTNAKDEIEHYKQQLTTELDGYFTSEIAEQFARDADKYFSNDMQEQVKVYEQKVESEKGIKSVLNDNDFKPTFNRH